MTLTHYIATGLGGALGAVLRLFLSKLLPATIFGMPMPILLINVVGCFVMGLFTELMGLYWSPTDNLRYFLITGLLGGFTTFSTFSLEFGILFEKDKIFLAFLYVALSVILGLMCFFLGIKTVKLL
jgi:CrcB protein